MTKPTLEQTQAKVENVIYKAALVFEQLEKQGLISCNGHHIAQDIAAKAAALVKERWTKTQTPPSRKRQ